MNALLLEKDASLRATSSPTEREPWPILTRANEGPRPARRARARPTRSSCASSRRSTSGALATGGLQTLVHAWPTRQVGTVYLLDDANRLVPIQATASDGRAMDHLAFGAEGLPKSVLERQRTASCSSAPSRSPQASPSPSCCKTWASRDPAPLRCGAGVPGGARPRRRGGHLARRDPYAGRRRRRVRARGRAAARGGAAQRMDARSLAREERRPRRARRALDPGEQGQDVVPRVDEPRAAHPAERDPRLRRPPAHVVERAAVAASARIARAHQAQRRAPAEPHQRRARSGEGGGGPGRGAPRTGQRHAAGPRLRGRGREPAIGQEPAPRGRRGRAMRPSRR